jgi:hypothetical protein
MYLFSCRFGLWAGAGTGLDNLDPATLLKLYEPVGNLLSWFNPPELLAEDMLDDRVQRVTLVFLTFG